MKKKLITIIFISFFISSCGKVGPLALSEEKLDKSVITYPCDQKCIDKYNAEKNRQQSVLIQSD